MSGCNQAWYSFKSSMVEHLGPVVGKVDKSLSTG